MAKKVTRFADFGRCYYCGQLDKVTKDHFIPVSKGGTVLVPACSLCQMTKRDLMPLEFAEYMENHIVVSPKYAKRIREAVEKLLEYLEN